MLTSALPEAVPSERRQSVRPKVDFTCSWRRDAQIADLNVSGCYVDTRAVPDVGKLAEFEIALPDGDVSVKGIVRHGRSGVGFAVQFDELDYDARVRIAGALNIVSGRLEPTGTF